MPGLSEVLLSQAASTTPTLSVAGPTVDTGPYVPVGISGGGGSSGGGSSSGGGALPSSGGGGSSGGGSSSGGGGGGGTSAAEASNLVNTLYDKAGFSDPVGQAWWTNQIASGAMTPSHAVAAFQAALPSPSSFTPVGIQSPLNVVSGGGGSTAGPIPGNLATASIAPAATTISPTTTGNYGDTVLNQYAGLGRSGFGTGATEVDQPGYDYWRGVLERGEMTPEQFITAFDAAAKTPTTPEEIAASVYGLYGRAGLGTGANQIDPGGFKYWTDQLKSGQLTPDDFAKKISYDLGGNLQLGVDKSTTGRDVHQYFYKNQDNPFAIADYASSRGLTAQDVAKATGLNMDQVRDYFGPVFTPLGDPIDKPGRGVGGQYGNVNGMPVLNRSILDRLIDSDLTFRGAGTNYITGGDKVNEDNALGWDTASDSAQYARGNAAFGVERFVGAMGGGPQISGDLLGLAKAVGVNPDDFMVERKSFYGPDVKELDQNALYDAVSEKTRDYYRVSGAVGTAPQDSAAVNRSDITGNHASVLYKAMGDKLVPQGDPTYYNAPYKVKSNALATVAMAIPMFFPGVGQAIGTAIGMSGTAANVVGSALFNAGINALVGADPVKGAISGGIGGFAQSMAGPIASNVIGAGDEALGAARIEELARAAGVSTSTVENAISSSLAAGFNAAVLGHQDALKTFGLSLAASFVGAQAKDKVKQFMSSLDPSDFNRAAIYASNAAGSVASSLINGDDVASNLVADLTDTHNTVNDYLGRQVGTELAGTGNQIGDMFGTPEGARVESENVYKKSQLFDDPNIDPNAELHTRTLIRQDAEGGEYKYLQTYDPQTKEYGLYSIVMEVNGQPAYLTKIDEVPGLEETPIKRDDETKTPVGGITVGGTTKTDDTTPPIAPTIPIGTTTPSVTTPVTTPIIPTIPSVVTPVTTPPIDRLPEVTVTAPPSSTGGIGPIMPIFTPSGGTQPGGTQPGGTQTPSLPPVEVTGEPEPTPSLPPVTVIGEPEEPTPSLPPVTVIGEPEEPTPSLPPVTVIGEPEEPTPSLPPVTVIGEPDDETPPTQEFPLTPPDDKTPDKTKVKTEIARVDQPVTINPVTFNDNSANAPATREWFDKYLTTSITPSRYEKIFDPIAATETLIEPSVSTGTDMTSPSLAALLASSQQPSIEELMAMLTGGQPSYYSYGDPVEDISPIPEQGPTPFRTGGLATFKQGGDMMAAPLMAAVGGTGVPHKGSHYVQGAGGGQDDLIDAKLADGEYVFDADVVAALGDGSNAEGAKKLDKMREAIRKHKRSAPNDKIPPKAKSPLAYLREVK